MRIIMGLKDAREALLKHRDPTSVDLSPDMKAKLREVFGQEVSSAEQEVSLIIAEVRKRGDAALRDFHRQFDGVELGVLEVTREEIARAYAKVDRDLLDAMHTAALRIHAFHDRQHTQGWMDLNEGLGQVVRPIDRVGIYVPGGKAAYPSTVLMTAIPARVAGVREVVVVTPCRERGEAPPVTLVACDIAKVDRVFRIGGPQAIAALAYGTESVPKVDKIFGPGNGFVQLAKKAVFGTVGVDAIQGPTETMVIADDSADPLLCAADMLAQAEHAEDAKPTLLTTSERLARQVAQEVERELRRYDQASPAHRSTVTYGIIAVLDSLDEAAEVANAYAPEHLCLLVRDPWGTAGKFTNAGGIFLGENSPEVLGDYVAGPSHVMPTAGTARFTSSLNVMDFVKITSIVGLSRETMRRIGPAAGRLGHGEGLPAHARAIEARLERLKEEND